MPIQKILRKSIEIFDAKISFISLVDRPANRRKFLMIKNAGRNGNTSFEAHGRILKSESKKDTHFVTGIAYEPLVADTDDNYMTAEEIEKMAHWFMKNGRMVDEQHSFDPNTKCEIVESWIANEDTEIGGQPVTKGTWLIKIEVGDSAMWEKIQNGELSGLSIGGMARYGTEDVELRGSTPTTVTRSQVMKMLDEALSPYRVEKGNELDEGSHLWDGMIL